MSRVKQNEMKHAGNGNSNVAYLFVPLIENASCTGLFSRHNLCRSHPMTEVKATPLGSPFVVDVDCRHILFIFLAHEETVPARLYCLVWRFELVEYTQIPTSRKILLLGNEGADSKGNES